MQEVDQQIAETKASIPGEEHSPLRDETTNQEPNHEWAKSELIKAQVELGTLEAHGQAIRIQVTGYREVAQRLGGNALRQGELLAELKAAEEKYLLYVNKREEARIEDALDQGGILERHHRRGTESAGAAGPGRLGLWPDRRDAREAR